MTRGSKQKRNSQRRRKRSRHVVRKKTVAQLLAEINREVRVLKKELTARQASSIYGKTLHLVLHPLVVKGNLDSVELSRSTSLCLCVPLEVLARVLQEAEASPKKETIGIMLGSLEGALITVSDAVPGEAKNSAHAGLTAEELARLLDRGKLRDPNAKFVGWYHSHLGHGAVASKVDLKTQSVLQQFSPIVFALIVDPVSKELEAYVTEAFSPTSAEAPQDIVTFKIPVTPRRTDGKDQRL